MVTAAPELSFDVDVTNSDGKWVQRGNHAIWCGSRTGSEPPYLLHEWTERGVRPFRHEGGKPVFHRVAQGTPYHIAHLFGFWVINDTDAMVLTAKRGDVAYTMLTIGGLTDRPAEATSLFVCPKCAARFGEEKFTALRAGYARFIEAALKRVRAFNADAALRRCPRCGSTHPPIYGFDEAADTPEERAARVAG